MNLEAKLNLRCTKSDFNEEETKATELSYEEEFIVLDEMGELQIT